MASVFQRPYRQDHSTKETAFFKTQKTNLVCFYNSTGDIKARDFFFLWLFYSACFQLLSQGLMLRQYTFFLMRLQLSLYLIILKITMALMQRILHLMQMS